MSIVACHTMISDPFQLSSVGHAQLTDLVLASLTRTSTHVSNISLFFLHWLSTVGHAEYSKDLVFALHHFTDFPLDPLIYVNRSQPPTTLVWGTFSTGEREVLPSGSYNWYYWVPHGHDASCTWKWINSCLLVPIWMFDLGGSTEQRAEWRRT